MVACRLAATLEWAVDEDTVHRESDQDLSALKQLLVELLLKLLYQHLMPTLTCISSSGDKTCAVMSCSL